MDDKIKLPNPFWILIPFVGFLYCIYKIHKRLNELTYESYPISPFQSVLFHFFPLYNYYWFFKWPDTLSKFLQVSNVKYINVGWLYLIPQLIILGFNVARITLPTIPAIILIILIYLFLPFYIILYTNKSILKYLKNKPEKIIKNDNYSSDIFDKKNEMVMTNEKDEVNIKIKEAKSFYDINSYYEAKNLLDECIQIDSNNYVAYYYRGMCDFCLKNYDDAISDWKKVIELNAAYKDELEINIKEAMMKISKNS